MLPDINSSDLKKGRWTVGKVGFSDQCYLILGEDPSPNTYEYSLRRSGIELIDSEFQNLRILGGEIRYANFFGISTASEFDLRTYGTLEIFGTKFVGVAEQAVHFYVPKKLNTPADYYRFERIVIDGIEVQDNGGEGIYIKGDRAVRGEVIVQNSVFGKSNSRTFGWDGHFTDYAGDAIDIVSGHPARIRNNQITNVSGAGIYLGIGHAYVTNNVVKDAYLENSRTPYKASIVINPHHYCYDGTTDIVVKNNVIETTRGVGLMVNGDKNLDCRVDVISNSVEVTSRVDDVVSMRSWNNTNIHIDANEMKGGKHSVSVYGEFPVNSSITRNQFSQFAAKSPIDIKMRPANGLHIHGNRIN